MNLTVQRLDNTTYNLRSMGIQVVDFQVESPSPRFLWEAADNQDGILDLGTSYGERTLRGSFEFMSLNETDFVTMRNTIFKVFASKEAFYLIDDREPTKRWLVKASGFAIEQSIVTLGRFDVEFICPSGYAEATTSTGGNASYTKNTATFSISNAGDITVNPRRYALVITYTGPSTNLKIKNNTTNEEWAYTGTTIAGDIIKLDGVRSLKNSLSIFNNTNRKLITLAPGTNSFTLTGTSGTFTINFDFRPLYL